MLPQCLGHGTEFVVKGYLDDKSDALVDKKGYPPIIDSVENYELQQDDVFVCAMGDVRWKKFYVEKVLKKGGEFVSLIHKNAEIERNTKIGKGCIISSNVSISCDVEVGDFVTFQACSSVGHDVRIGDYSHLGCRSFMGGYAQLGSLVTLQTNAIVLPHIKVGNESTVGAGAVAIRKVKDGETVFGNPARRLDF